MANAQGRRRGIETVAGLIFAVLVMISSSRDAEAKCESQAAEALRSDSKNATLWTFSWAGIYAAGAVGQYLVARELVDDEDVRFNLYVGAVKSGLGMANQFVFPMRIEGPGNDCENLPRLLDKAKETEDWKRGWFPHTSLVLLNLAGSVFVYRETENLRLTIMGSLIGSAIGEIAIFTTPNRVRSGDFQLESVGLLPSVSAQMRGLSLVGSF